MAAIRHMQITLSLPEPREYTSMPQLHLVQSGIQRTYTAKGKNTVADNPSNST